MRAALACIPDSYAELALSSDAWLRFLCALAVLIHGMQAFERAVLRLVESVVLYPLRRILHTYQHGDPAMIEYYSATCASLFGLWVVAGRSSPTLRQITETIPWWIWSNPAMLIGIFQGIAVQHGNSNTRALFSFLAFLLWSWLSAITYRRLGFNAIHSFTVPLMLACWIVIFIHLRGQNGSAAESTR